MKFKPRIDIDFLGGAHGNFLEFALNKILLGSTIAQEFPFNALGASHWKSADYLNNRVFISNHYSLPEFPNSTADMVVSVQFSEDDLLQLTLISLLRAGHTIDPDKLEVGTYYKFDNPTYQCNIDKINAGFSSVDAYNNIKADTWPKIHHATEFLALPDWIQEECLSKFGVKPFYLSPQTPDCPRHVLREFYKKTFLDVRNSGLWKNQERMTYQSNVQVYVMPYSAFYSVPEFSVHVRKIFEFFKLTPSDYNHSMLHSEFLERQVYKNTKVECDTLVTKILNGDSSVLPQMSVVHEAYIDAKLEQCTGKEMPVTDDTYFSTTEEAYRYIYEI